MKTIYKALLCRAFFVFIFLLLKNNYLFSQNFDYSRKILETLCADSMAGRGYVEDGAIKSAHYISSQFLKNDLLSFSLLEKNNPNYFYQPFSISVNTFPGKAELNYNGNDLIPGKDFIIASYSASIKGKYKVIPLDTTVPLKSSKCFYSVSKTMMDNTPLLESKIKSNFFKAVGYIIEYPTSIPWNVSTTQKNFTTIFLFTDSSNSTHQPINSSTHQPINSSTHQPINLNIETNYINKFPLNNVAGFIKGKTFPDSFIVISAHYDHLGKLGKEAIFRGANDNASGISLLLTFANYFADSAHRLDCSVAFIAFAAEEAGLLGSEYFVKNPLMDLKKIKFLINLDLVGFGQDGIMVVNGTVYPQYLHLLDSINKANQYLKEVKSRGKAQNSDHYHFSEKGVKSFFLYTLGGAKAYHDIYDVPENISFEYYPSVFSLIKDFIFKIDKKN